MKILLILACLITSYSIGKAQSKYSFDNYSWNNILYHANLNKPYYSNIDSFALTHKIYRINKNITYYSKKKKANYSTESINFDSKGRSYNRLKSSDTGQKQHIYLMASRNYNSLDLLQSSYFSSQYTTRTEFYEYNDSNRIIKSTYFNKKNKYSGQTCISYNTKGKESNVTYFNNKNKPTKAYDYFYHGNGQLKQTVLKDKKGKVKLVTDYTCDDIGKKVEKLKDTAKICSTKSYLPNGHIITTTNGFNYIGKPYKTVEIRDSFNQIIKYEYFLGIKEELLYSSTYSYTNGRLTKTEVRNQNSAKKGYFRITENDLNGRIIKDETTYLISKSKQITWKNSFTYDSKGLLTREQSYKNNQLVSETTFTYNYYK